MDTEDGTVTLLDTLLVRWQQRNGTASADGSEQFNMEQ